jgi:ligand-binding sensor domain-containing protein/signal transduction histidine kinase
MWFGTKDGLNRFDGYTFKIYRNNPADSNSIGNNSIWRLYEDERGTLWVGTERGLYSYDYASEKFSLLKEAPQSEISGITTDKQGNLWLISGFKLFRFSFIEKNIKRYDDSSILNFCVTIARSLTGDIWVGNINGQILRYNPATNRFLPYSLFSHSKPTTSGWIEKIYDSGLGFLFVGTSNQGVKTFNLSTHEYTDLLTYNEDHTEIYVRDFIRNTDKEFWIATESGIYIYNAVQHSFQHLKKNTVNPYALSDNAIYSFAKDKEGGIWACSYFGGVNYYSKQKLAFEKYFFIPGTHSLQGNAVREIKQDNKGNIWIGTEDAGLNRLNPKTGKFITLTPEDGHSGIAHTNIHGLLVDGNHLWVGTFEHGLNILDLTTQKVIRHFVYGNGPNQLKSNFIHSLFKSSAGTIFIGTSNGMYSYNKRSQNFKPLSFFPDNVFFSSITEDKKGNLWIGTFKNGLYYYNPSLKIFGRLKFIKKNTDRFEKSRVTYIYIDRLQQLWVCTEDGLFKIIPGTKKIVSYSTENGLPGNLVYSIIEDNNNYLWITTSKGLLRLNPETGATHTFTQTNGLLSNQFNYSSAFKDNAGYIYFGSVKGLIRFNPSQLDTQNNVPPVYITNMQINNVDVNITRNGPLTQSILHTNQVTLNHLQSSISFNFAALHFTSPQNVEYAYRLEGAGESWNYIKTNRTVYFTNLSPGTYRFVVKSNDSNGNWPPNEKSIIIKILPPWWLSKWAYAVYTAFLIAIVYLVINFYHNRQKEKQKAQMALFEREKEKETYESKIDFFTKIAHEIRTPLTLIKAPLEKLMRNLTQSPQNEKYLMVMSKNTERLLDLTTQLLDFRRVEAGAFTLTLEEKNINDLLKGIWNNFYPLAENKKVQTDMMEEGSYQCKIDEEAVTKIISNLLDNAIKYCHHKVSMSVSDAGDGFVEIAVSNDGPLIPDSLRDKIFEPFFRSQKTDKITGTGIGLALSRSLAELLGGSLHMQVEDHLNVFVLKLPVDN